MGLWAGITHALNSTLGTKDFEPLDVQIAEQRTMYASDELYVDTGNQITFNRTSTSEPSIYEEYFPVKTKMRTSGSFKIGFMVNAQPNTCIIYIYKNGQQIQAIQNAADNSYQDLISDNILFEKGDEFSFKAFFQTGGLTIRADFYGAKIYGTVKQNVMYLTEV